MVFFSSHLWKISAKWCFLLLSFFFFNLNTTAICKNKIPPSSGSWKNLKVHILVFFVNPTDHFKISKYCQKIIPKDYQKIYCLAGTTSMFITFWDFSRVEQIFLSPKVKRNVIISNKHGQYVKCVQIRSCFWSVFSYIWTEYRKIRTKNNSAFGLSTQWVRMSSLMSYQTSEYLRS